MRRFPLALALALLLPALTARAEFGTSLDEGEKESKAKGKLMLVYIFSPTCHVCKGLNDKVWPSIAVQTELENWVAVKVESNEAVKSKYRWKIDDVPQLRVISPEGNEFKCFARNDISQESSKMIDALASVRGEWETELSSRKFDWEASFADAKSKARDRNRPICVFVHDTDAPAAIINEKFPIFLDKTAAAASKTFVCVPSGKDDAPVREKYKPQAIPGFLFLDADGAELHRCGFLDASDLAAQFQTAYGKFEAAAIADPTKLLEKAIASFEASLKGDVEQDKVDAAQKLIDLKDPKVVKPLTSGLSDPSVKLKELIAPAILQLDLKNGLTPVLKWVMKESNNKLAVKGWDAIGETGDLRAVPALEDNVLEAPSQEITRARIRALGNMRDKSVVDFLIDLPFKVKGKGRGPGGGGGIHKEIQTSLNKLTGQDFGDDWLGWKRWWRDAAKTFKFE
jgi:thioredoxin-related protein